MSHQLSAINLKKLLPYLGIFFVLLMGSGLVKIPAGSVWFYTIKFGIIAVVLGLGIYFLHRQLITDYLKLALFVPFTIDFHLHYAFIFLTIILFNKKLLLPWNSPLKPIYLLFIWGFISYIINQFIEFNPLTFPYFVVMFFVPWLIMGLFYQVKDKEQKDKLILFFLKMVTMMSLVLFLQTIALWNKHPDYRNGGTIGVHTAALFLAIAFLIALNDLVKNKLKPIYGIYTFYLFSVSIPFIFLLDGKYILALLFITIVIYLLSTINKKVIKFALIGSLVLLVGFWYTFSNRNLPISIMMWQGYGLSLDGVLNSFNQSARGQLIQEAIKLPLEDPVRFLIGSGPGTFLSHCSRLDGYINNNREFINYGFKEKNLRSTLTISLFPKTSWITKKFETTILSNNKFTGSLYDTRSSMFSIFFEFGVVGLILLAYMFFKAAYIPTGSLSPILISVVFLLFAVSFFELWLERPHYGIMTSFFLIIVNKEN